MPIIAGGTPASWSGTGACAGLSYAGKTTLKEVADTCATYLSSVVGGGGVHWVGGGGCGTTGGTILFKQYNYGGFAVGEGATPADGWVNGSCGWTEPAKPGQTAGWDNTYTLTNSGGTGATDTCPTNATGTGSPITACTCNSGFTASGSVCVPGACAARAGQTTTANFTSGWLYSAPTVVGANVWPGLVPPGMLPVPATACDNGCRVSVDASGGAPSYVSLVPSSNGLYRLSSTRPITANGETCTIGPADLNNPDAPEPPCGGYVGLVGGKITCIPPAGAPASSPAPSGPTTTGNPPAGSSGASAPPTGGTGGSGAGGGGAAGGTGTGGSTGTSGKNEDGGDCAANPSAAGCGGAVGEAGTLYDKKSPTFGDKLTAFKNQVQGSALGTATGGFFNVSGGGTCPTFSATIPYIDFDMNINQFCSEFATNALALFKLALLVVAGISAFRVAVL